MEVLIDLLDDDHAREISAVIVDEPKTAREIVAQCESSRTTVYRRLSRLQEAGLLSTDLRYDADGHHRTTYYLRFDSLSIRLDTGGLDCAIESTDG
ncbi:ArsR/SmtB family transcription factor [Halohasta salina]|uniref:ArsR/SmtB family transcription factor n=1 Tax=Halohasta salina TaxID=2961621 RepID=UPI0020A24E90|nr:winged helix-turn-helix domain-containing protein [Halohasta salina]